MISIQKKHSKKSYIIALVVLGMLLVGMTVYAWSTKMGPFAQNADETSAPGKQKVDLKRSKTEEQATKSLQDDPSLKTQNDQRDVPETPSQAQSGKAEVNVLLTNAGITNGTVSASGFVTNMAEDGGTCTYTFTNGTSKLVKSTSTLQNPTSTTCETVRFPATELNQDGKWTVNVTYGSADAYGVSNEQVFTK